MWREEIIERVREVGVTRRTMQMQIEPTKGGGGGEGGRGGGRIRGGRGALREG